MNKGFKVNIIYNKDMPSFQTLMNKIYLKYLEENIENLAINYNQSYNNYDKENSFAKKEEVKC